MRLLTVIVLCLYLFLSEATNSDEIYFNFNLAELEDLSQPISEERIEELVANMVERTDRAGQINCTSSWSSSCSPVYKYRHADGSCNNLHLPWWGASNTPFKRLLRPDYDGPNQDRPRRRAKNGGILENPRVIAKRVHYPDDKPQPLTMMGVAFGQFIMHDLVHSELAKDANGNVKKCRCDPNPPRPDCINVPVSPNDIYNKPCLIQIRSEPIDQQKFDCEIGFREQINSINSFVDLSVIYGNTFEQSENLRSKQDGLLRVSLFDNQHTFPPSECDSNNNLFNQTVCFKSGDSRIDQYPLLTSMHTIWLREHNRVAAKLKQTATTPKDDETLYQEAKRIVSAEYQHIVYNEWLPVIVGEQMIKIFDLLPKENEYFDEYDSFMFPNVANEFGAAASRVGHVLFKNVLSSVNNNLEVTKQTLIRNFMFRPDMITKPNGLNEFVSGCIYDRANRFSEHVNNELSNNLIHDLGPNNPTHFYSLPTFNVNRGRDHGLRPYNHYRPLAALARAQSFQDLTNIPGKTIDELRKVYNHVEDIDLFTGGTSERNVYGGVVGQTFAYILARGFRDWKYTDRFFYEFKTNSFGTNPHPFTLEQLDALKQVRMADIICRNTDISQITEKVFLGANSNNNYADCSQLSKDLDFDSLFQI